MGRTLKITLAYDGTPFVGWQRQAAGESIQGLLEDALAQFEGAAVTVHGAGRTDAGVHALGQVASAAVTCGHDTAALVRGLNVRLPPTIRVLAVEDAPPGFHARYAARAKTYRYQLQNAAIVSPFEQAYVWHVPHPLDVMAMRRAARCLIGTHDFAALQSAGGEPRTTVRTITRADVLLRPGVGTSVGTSVGTGLGTSAASRFGTGPGSGGEASDPGRMLVFEVAGDGFLRHMVRAIAGTLVEVGRGWRSADDMSDLLAGGVRHDAGATAPPQGLFLVRVDYD